MAEFEAMDVFYSRSDIEYAMRTNLIEGLEQYHALVDSFQLLDIVLPGHLNDALQDTEELNLEIKSAEYTLEEEAEKA